MGALKLPWIEEKDTDHPWVCVDPEIYPLQALYRACYLFTDRCYLFLTRVPESPNISVHFAGKGSDADLRKIVGEFCNELMNQQVRLIIAKETQAIRELIVAQAFAEAEFIEPPSESDGREGEH
jgi:His-Xaa-Ser system protein HxsD